MKFSRVHELSLNSFAEAKRRARRDQMQKSTVHKSMDDSFEDFVVVSPSEAGEAPLEYCLQDSSRPKLFPVWGGIVPIKTAVTSLINNFLDSRRDGTVLNNVTLEEAHSPTNKCSWKDEKKEQQSEIPSKFDSHAQRRRSLKKFTAFNSFGESETEYSFHRFKLNSKDSSTDDFFVLKVKTRSCNSLASPTLLENRYFTESVEKDSTEKDSPAPSYYRRESDQPNASRDFVHIKGMANKKSLSEPVRTDFVDEDSFKSIDMTIRLNQPEPLKFNDHHASDSTSSKTQLSEERIKNIIKTHCDKFVQYSNWSTLLPYLEAGDLLDPDTRDKLMSSSGEREKSNYFYLTSLPSQGKDAYTKFYNCLVKEKEHAGHKTLQELFS